MSSPPPVCPICHEDVPPNAKACPSCGADDRSGWSDNARYDGLDLPDEAWEDGEEHPHKKLATGPIGVPLFWKIVAVVVLLTLLWYFFT